MGRTLTIALCLFSTAALAVENAVKDQVNLVGTWKVTSVEANGNKFPEVAIKDFQFIFTPEKMTRKKDGKIESEAAYRLDAGQSPKWMDFLGPEGENQKVVKILYALEGDALQLCFRVDYKREGKVVDTTTRPTKLSGGAGTEQVLMHLKRQSP